MRLPRTALLPVLVVAAGLLAAASDKLPKLPEPRTLPTAGESPSPVVFDHASHVDEKKPDCTTCHAKLFPILKKSEKPFTHEQMKKGENCGFCHNGKEAFDLENCDTCHKGE